MKNKLIILIAALAFAGCTPGQHVHYIILTDRIDQDFVDGFNYNFFDQNKPLTQYLPSDVAEMTVDVYHPFVANTECPFHISLGYKESKDDMGDAAKAFMDKMATITKQNANLPEQDILHQLSEVIQLLKDTNARYSVIISGRLIENSGGPIQPGLNPSWKSGNFRFASGDNVFETDAIDAAKAQFSDKSSWISQNLIAPANANQVIQKGHATFYVDMQTVDMLHCEKPGRYPKEITDFWHSLFVAMHVPSNDRHIESKDFLN